MYERLFELGNDVIDPVPQDKQRQFRYWRGMHMGRIALNLGQGLDHLNPPSNDIVTHFADNHGYAKDFATYIASGEAPAHQFDEEADEELSLLTGQESDLALPTIVVALDKRFNRSQLPPSTIGAAQGFMFEDYLTVDMLDPYSQEAIDELLS